MAERIDLFRRALAGATRAIAKDAEAEVIRRIANSPQSSRERGEPSPQM